MQYELFNLDGSSSKTWKGLSAQSSRGKDGTTQPEPLYCSMSFVSWKEKVTIVRGEYSQRLLQARHTRENESLSSAGWPSSRASEYKDVGPVGSKSHDHTLKRHYLCAVVKQEEIDGPPAQENPSTSGKSQELWATPRADKLGAEKLETWAKRNKEGKVSQQPLPTQVRTMETRSMKLNPSWVEQLMGLQVGWTQLPTEWID